ncbi:hypothetical protein [Fluviicola sp.]|uniref:hypothetical protein n=1 Tax=Fluviicola sp. TaxID=1917219 RepID=UPI003D2884DA
MKTQGLFMLLLIIVLGISSCKKQVGPQGETGATGAAGPDAKTFNFNLTFTASDTYQSYSGVTGYDEGDVVLTFIYYKQLSGTNYWVQLPLVSSGTINIFAEFSETNGNLFINTEKADGSAGSPWTSTNTFMFKAVLIKSSGLIKHPDVDLTNYEQVMETFKL